LGAIIALSLGGAAWAADWIWARGCLHTHTKNSDGTGTPQAVADWYRANGYQFLAITDHEKVTDVAPLDADPNDGFILIPGEELAVTGEGVPIHANALGIAQTLKSPPRSKTSGETVRNLVDYIRKAGGIPMVNHPNWYSALDHRDLLAIKGPYLLEIANMGEGSENQGSPSRLSTEQSWDVVLSNGRTVYATATDDMHVLEEGPTGPNGPGKGWVVARVPELTPSAILKALTNGDFYASTGVELADYGFDGREFRVRVAPQEGRKYLIRFVGKWGKILQETVGTKAVYRFAGKPEPNAYVRCKVIADDKKVAWTQAYRLN
jgi:hypothetical protein